MTLLKKIEQYKLPVLLALFFVVHVFLFNINVAEWGDSYRILRASESLKEGFYPMDEKRPPLFSFILSTQPDFTDQVTYGRTVLLVFSLASFLVFYLLLQRYTKSDKWLWWGMLALLLNNVYLYWSIRIMADVPFGFIALLAVYLYELHNEKKQWIRPITLGVLCGLAVLTRFEGYLLTAAVGAAMFFENFKFNVKDWLLKTKKILPFVIAFAVVAGPYIYARNPFTSSYLEEPSGRKYDFAMLSTYIVSLLSVFGIISAWYVIASQFKALKKVLSQNLALTFFVGIELFLILLWPAAVPRLFVSIIPFLLIVLVAALESFFENKKRLTNLAIAANLGLLGIYVGAQYWLRLQFLVLDKKVFAINLVLQLLIVGAVAFKKFKEFFILSVITMTVWSLSVIYLHRDIFISVKNAAEYASQNFTGNIAYNDVSSVSEWYLNYQYKRAETRGFYYNTEKKQNLNEDVLKAAGIDYLLITNEHNTTMTLDLNKRPYLRELKVFEYLVNGQTFVTRLVEVL